MSSSLGGNFAWCVPKSFRICSQPATSHSDFHRLPLHDIARGLPERRTKCPHRKPAYRPPSPPRSVSSGRTILNKKRYSSRMSASTEPMCGNLLEMRTRASSTVPASTAVSSISLVVFALVVARSALGGPTTVDVEDAAASPPLTRLVKRWHEHLVRHNDSDADAMIDTMGQVWTARATGVAQASITPRHTFAGLGADRALRKLRPVKQEFAEMAWKTVKEKATRDELDALFSSTMQSTATPWPYAARTLSVWHATIWFQPSPNRISAGCARTTSS